MEQSTHPNPTSSTGRRHPAQCEYLIERHGQDKVGFMTVTVKSAGDPGKAVSSLQRLTKKRIFKAHFPNHLWVMGVSAVGRIHFHILLCCAFNIAKGFDLESHLAALSETGEFQGLFQFRYEEEFYRGNRWGPLVDLQFLSPVQISFSESCGRHHSGRFLGEVETSDETVGDTTGTFRLHLPRGLDGGEAKHILDTASLDVVIESVPGW